MYALEIVWHEGINLPTLIGPFTTEQEAQRWADINVPNGVPILHPLARPYAAV